MLKQAEALVRDHHSDPGDGSTQPASSELRVSKRIRGELFQLVMRVRKRAFQKYMKQVRAISSLWTDLEKVPAQSHGRSVGGADL